MAFLHILHLEDSEADHELVAMAMMRSDWDVQWTWVDNLDDYETALRDKTHPVDLVLADYHLGGFTAMEAWKRLNELYERLMPFVLVSGAIGEATVADAIVQGVNDYVDKNQLMRLPQVVERVLALAQALRAEVLAQEALEDSRRRLADFAEHLQTSIERERADIAREIHDDIGGSLAAAKLNIAALMRRLHDPESQRQMQTALEMTEHALGASQRIMRNLRPAILDQGLWAGLQWLTRTFAERSGLEVRVTGGERLGRMSPKVAMVAYRTVQESLTNVLKHAQATQVTIDLSDLDDCLMVEIADDGKGATADDLAKSQSFGLLGLNERAHTVGGWLDVVTQPGQGMTLILTIPLTDHARMQAGGGHA